MARKTNTPDLMILDRGTGHQDERMTVVCKPRTWGPAAVRSVIRACAICGEHVWLSVRAPRHDAFRILCIPCGVAELRALDTMDGQVAVSIAPWVADDLKGTT